MPGYGYRSGDADRPVSVSPSPSSRRDRGDRKRRLDKVDKKQQKKDKKRKRGRDEADVQRAGSGIPQDRQQPVASSAGGPAQEPASQGSATSRKATWRDEMDTKVVEDDAASDGFVAQETDEDVERKLAESRARREQLIAKWVNRGEGGELMMPDTNTSLHDEEPDSDGEVAAFLASQKDKNSASIDAEEDDKALEEKKAVNRFILEHRAKHDSDMFNSDEEAQEGLNQTTNLAQAISQTGADGSDWNDIEGYYKATVGELIDDRYLVVEDNCGKGVFSSVIKAKDKVDGIMVAIKVMRCNDMMRKAAEKEVEVLERLAAADKGNKRNVIRMLRHFMYRDHLCIVFECMWDNLRVALKKYTKDRGMSLKAVRPYVKQLLIALQHIHRCELIHADIKPDNILITAGNNLVKICDLGSAVELTEVEATPYLVSRFYRAPEICLGAKYGPPADVFAMGATMCELFTGKILFPGKSNNDMLRLFMEIKGKPPNKVIKSGMCWKQHFDEKLDFKYNSHDKVTRKKKLVTITDMTAKRSILDLVMARVGPERQKSEDREDQLYVRKAKEFADLINQMTVYDPEKRGTTEELLQHPFIAGIGFGAPKPKVPEGPKSRPAVEQPAAKR